MNQLLTLVLTFGRLAFLSLHHGYTTHTRAGSCDLAEMYVVEKDESICVEWIASSERPEGAVYK